MEKTILTITFESQEPLTGEFAPMANLIDAVKDFSKKAKEQGVKIQYNDVPGPVVDLNTKTIQLPFDINLVGQFYSR